MNKASKRNSGDRPTKPNVFSLLKPYRGMVFMLVLFALLSNGVNLLIPKIISSAIDSFSS